MAKDKYMYIRHILVLIFFPLFLFDGCNIVENTSIYKVRYHANGADSGTVPVDNTEYGSNQYATVCDNSGNLIKNNYLFAGWNESPLGSKGMDCEPLTQIEIKNEDLVLYAKWVEHEYDFDEETGTITAYNFTYNDIRLPKELNDIPVTIIGNNIFYGQPLRSVVIPDSIVKIGIRAFSETNLTNVTIPGSVNTIDSSCFQNSKLTAVTLNNGIQYINTNAFYGSAIANVTIPDTVTDIGQGAFAANKLTTVVIPDKIVIINKGSFQDNEISELTFPEGVIEIKESAFQNNDIESLTLPATLKKIKIRAFGNNPITKIIIGSNVEIASGYSLNGPNIFTMGLYGDFFYDYYRDKKKVAGQYTYDGQFWHLNAK
jgi:hypothetical protein